MKSLGPDRLELKFEDGSRSTDWGANSVFPQARALGYNTGIVGWHLPYCRILNEVLTACWWDDVPSLANSTEASGLLQGALYISRGNLDGGSFSLVGSNLLVEHFAAMYRMSTVRAKELATDPRMGLVLLHLPGAHDPLTYNRNSGTWDRRVSRPSAYPDSLALVDRTLGEIRRAMVAAGEWDRTTLIVTADHWYREADRLTGRLDRRVPFLVKLAGQTGSLEYADDFNTIVTRDLLLAVLRHEITTPREIVSWLDQRRAGPIPQAGT
jgi:hypothetical protein